MIGDEKMRRKKINPLTLLGMIVFCGFFIINIIAVQVKIRNTFVENIETQAEIKEQKDENQQLKDIIENGTNDLDYVKNTARDKLGFGEANEKVYINVTGN